MQDSDTEPMLKHESPMTVDQNANINDPKPEKGFKAFWWIIALVAVNVVCLSANIHLALKTSSKVAAFQEKPLESLPRPDPLYGVPGKSGNRT
ncbi:hypothetical protein MD484_g8100, partial [Candolleomyces efflorescens]